MTIQLVVTLYEDKPEGKVMVEACCGHAVLSDDLHTAIKYAVDMAQKIHAERESISATTDAVIAKAAGPLH